MFATINIAGLAWIHHDLMSAPRATVRVLSASLMPDKENPDRIAVSFDRELVGETAVGQVEKAGMFRMTPAWPGQWLWAAQDRLEYILDKPFSSGRVLTLSATPQVKSATGRTLEGTSEFKLVARPLRLVSSGVVASDRTDITLQVTFNQPVDPREFLRRVSLYDDKIAVRLSEPLCLTPAAQKDLVIRFARPASNRFKMVVDGSLTGGEPEARLGSSVSVIREVAPGFALLHSYVERLALEKTASVRLFFSQSLSDKQQPPQLAVEPAVEDLHVYLSYNSLEASGKFIAGRRYTIRVPGTLLSEQGKTLGEGVSVAIEIPDHEPAIAFEHSSGILSPRGTLTVDAKGVNLDQVELQAWRVHANNLVPHLHGTQVAETSQSVLDKTVRVKSPHNEVRKLALGLADLLSQPLGVYLVEARAHERHWAADRTIITITDLAITAKRHRDGYLVWVTSLRTAEPVSDVEVGGLTYNNQTVATARTNAERIAELRFAGHHPDGEIWAITAAKDNDLSYLVPDENRWMIDDIEQSGRPYAEHYEVMLYTDRGVYRPGETIHLTGVIRDTTGMVASRFPLSVKIHRPDGRQMADLLVNRREKDQGMFHTSFTPSAEAQTGAYQFCVTLPGSEDVLGSTGALVEAFVPVRMEVKAAPSSERFGPNTPPAVKVTGRYLWDQPAGDLPVRLEGTLWPTAFESKAHPDFQFGSNRREASILLPAADGQLDGQGGCEVQVNLPEALKAGLYAMRVSATVTEPGGRRPDPAAFQPQQSRRRHGQAGPGLRVPGNAPAEDQRAVHGRSGLQRQSKEFLIVRVPLRAPASDLTRKTSCDPGVPLYSFAAGFILHHFRQHHMI
jgi:hypothetical protein